VLDAWNRVATDRLDHVANGNADDSPVPIVLLRDADPSQARVAGDVLSRDVVIVASSPPGT
jgi:hypothetical protein